MTKEFAGNELAEIRQSLAEEGFTEVHEDRGAAGIDLWRPFDGLPSHHCVHAVVWRRAEGGFWVEEY
jgi:hypothetical protein